MGLLSSWIETVRERCAAMPDKRTGANARYPMADVGLAAFSLFFMQSPSFLAHQKTLAERQGRSNCATLFGMASIPTDNHIRDLLDGVPSGHFDGLFLGLLRQLDERGGLEPLRVLGGRVLVALDGTEHFCSRKISCANCSTRRRSDGGIEHFHRFLGATLVAPGHATVLPLAPEFLVPQDGADKQDSEPAAVARWLARHGPGLKPFKPVYLGDDLFARQPTCQAVLDAGGDFLFTCKPASHRTIQEYLAGVQLEEAVEDRREGRTRRRHRLRWIEGVPLRDGKDALTVNWLELEISDAKGKVTYRNSFVTSLPVTRGDAAQLAACGRARWKIENETFNVLKTGGYHLEHNFGHGKATLSNLLVAINLLAFALHHAADLADAAWKRARDACGARQRLFEHLRSITVYLLFPDWEHLLSTVAGDAPPALAPPAPS